MSERSGLSELDAAVEDWRDRVTRVGDDSAAQMVRAYSVVETELLRRISLLEEKMKAHVAAGGEIKPAWLFQQERYRELLSQAQRYGNQYGALAGQVVEAQQIAAVRIAYVEAARQVSAMGPSSSASLSYGWADVDDPSLQRIIGALQAETPLGRIVQTLGDDLSQGMKDVMARGMATGVGADVMVRALVKELRIPKVRAARIARTEVLRASNEGLRRAFIESGVVDGWQWSASLSARTCAACLANNGKVFPLSQRMQRHVQCRCSMSPWSKGMQTYPSGDEWLSAQTPAAQDKVLGKAGGAAYRAGDVTLDDFVYLRKNDEWGDSYQRKPWKVVRREKGLEVDTETAAA